MDHIKLYEGNHPVENWLKSNTPDGDSEVSDVEPEKMVSEHENVSMGETGQLIKNSEADTSELVNSQHSDLNATIQYRTTSPSVPSADLDETMPYGMDEQTKPNSNLNATIPYGTTSPSVPSADLDETMPYGMDEQTKPNSDLNATIPYGTTFPPVPSADLDETMPYGMDEQTIPNSDLDATIPYGTTSPSVQSADIDETKSYGVGDKVTPISEFDATMPCGTTPKSVPSTDLEQTMPYGIDELLGENFPDNHLLMPISPTVLSTDLEESLPSTPGHQPSIDTDLNDTISYGFTQPPLSPLSSQITTADKSGLSNTDRERLGAVQNTAITPEHIPNDSVVSADSTKSDHTRVGAATSAPCETTNLATNKTSLSGMLNPVDDDARPLAIRRTRRPLKPRVILDL